MPEKRLPFRPEGDEASWVGFQPRGGRIVGVDEVDAVGDGGEYRFETLVDALGPARQVDHERASADPGRLPGEDCRRHVAQLHLPHQLAEPR